MPVDTVLAHTDAIDAIAARFAARGGQPGLAYGIVADGELVHAGGLGARRTGGPAPDAGTVFRIASMTKSFTAALVLLLRDEGALRLDDPAHAYVPALAALALPAEDSRPPTIRNLLTMTAGFPTDDPWGDRQQGLPPADFTRLLAGGGVRYAWAPGTRFEYANLGYALLGQVIESVTGRDYAAVVRDRLLVPLRMSRTGYEASEFEAAELTGGYQRSAGRWLELEPDPYGAFAPMGGIFTCVRDLAPWISGFAGAFPSRCGEDAHPLSRASRREMQLPHVAIAAGGDGTAVRFSGPLSVSYGFGLFVEDDPVFGTIVQHSGGYPGYGSQMRWHPGTGLGAVVLANSTYAAAGALASELLAALLAAGAAAARPANSLRLRGPMPDTGAPWPQTLAARDAVGALLADWRDEDARRIFSPNVDLDRPLADRSAEIDRLRERIGTFAADEARGTECDSPAHCRWWLTGPGGTVAVTIRLAPLVQPLVQQLVVTVPPALGSPLASALSLLTGVIQTAAGALAGAGADGPGGAGAQWPADLPVADGVRPDAVLRELQLAAAWAGRPELDCYLTGDGETTTTARLVGPTGRVDLSVELGPGGQLVRAAVVLVR